MTRAQLNTYIDTNITNKTAVNSLTPVDEGNALKEVANYVDQQDALNELLVNKSTNVALGTSDTLYPTQNAVKTYVDANAGLPYTFWRAIINKTSVVRVLYDGIGFTSPTISNPFNGVVYVTKTGFFTSIDPNKLEFISTNLDNSGVVFVTLANQSDGVNPNNEFQVNIYDMAGGQSSTPSGNVTVEIRIYA
jgi:hypothetical protein